MGNVNLRRAWEWITEVGKAGWIITSVVLVVACVALGINIASYNIQSRTDHASVYTTRIYLSAPAAEDTLWDHDIQNSGREDAAGVKLKLGTVDDNGTNPKLLGADEWVRLAIGASGEAQLPIHRKDFRDFFVTCLTYRDARGQTGEELFFYQLPVVPLSNMGAAPKKVSQTVHDKLSSGFSCAKL
jgi:hypothetical protein